MHVAARFMRVYAAFQCRAGNDRGSRRAHPQVTSLSRSSCALFSANHDWYHLRGIFIRDSAFDSRLATRDTYARFQSGQRWRGVSRRRRIQNSRSDTQQLPTRTIASQSSQPDSISCILFHPLDGTVNGRAQWTARLPHGVNTIHLCLHGESVPLHFIAKFAINFAMCDKEQLDNILIIMSKSNNNRNF